MRKVHEEATRGSFKLLQLVLWFQPVHPLVLQNFLGLFLKNSSGNHQCWGLWLLGKEF